MAFGGAPMGGATHLGPELLEITQEVVGFQSLAGEAKVRLATPWPEEQLPSPTSSLLAIAQKAGLLAAGGPDGIYMARTETVRKRFSAGVTPDSNNIDLTPELKLPMPQRISQICFTSDEKYLAISAEQGGGLAFYEVASLLQGNTQSAFEMGTGGVSLRMLLPNPTQGELLAMITMNGDLILADLNSRQIVPNGQPVRSGITSASWSAKGKQIAAGTSQGTVVQLTPQGVVKAEIPKPNGLGMPGQHVASMMWLENDVFLVIYTASKDDPSEIPVSDYILITRKDNAFTYQKLQEVCSPFGKNRSPQYQFLQRLRDFPPNLQDVIIVSSTCSDDIELFTRSKTPLTSAVNAAQITNVFTTTKTQDNRRAQLPMMEDGYSGTSPLGVVLDLSSTTPVDRPLPGEEMDRSPGPLPALIALNNQGLLSAWWFIYAESIRQGTTYPGLVAAASNPQQQQQQSQAPANPFATNASTPSAFGSQTQAPANPFATGTANNSTFGKPAFGQSTFGQSSFGNQQSSPAFGNTSGSTFGSSSQPGATTSAWGSSANKSASAFGQSTFGQPAFGQTATPAAAPAFGSNTGLGSQSSPWGSKSTATTSTFGQVGMPSVRTNPFASPSTTSAFGASAAGNASSSGFSAFANRSGFAGASGGPAQSVFGQASSAAPTSSSTPAFGEPTKPTFGTLEPTPAPQPSAFGPSSNSAFGGGTSTSWLPSKPTDNASSNSGFFGSSFGSALQTPATNGANEATDADMDDGPDNIEVPQRDASMSPEPEEVRREEAPPAVVPEPAKPVETKQTPKSVEQPPAKSETAAPPPAPLPPFGAPAKTESANMFAKNVPLEKSSEGSTAKPEESSKTPEPAKPLFNPFAPTSLPLPPDTTSKTTYTPTNSTTSSKPPSDRAASDTSAAPEIKAAEIPSFTPVKPQKTPSIFDTPLSNEEKTNSNPFAHLSGTDQAIEDDDEDEDEDEDGEEEAEEEDAEHDEEDEDDIPSESASWASEEEDQDATNDEGSGVDVADELTPPEHSPQAVSKGLFSSPVGGSSAFAAAMTAANKKHAPKSIPTSHGIHKARRGSSTVKNQRPSVWGPHGGSPPGKNAPLRSSSPPNVVRPLHSSFVQTPAKSAAPQAAKSKPSSTNPARTARRVSTANQEPLEEDHEEIRMRKELFTEPDATTVLAPLLTHQDYVGSTHKTGIPAQIEILYKDVNSMIDTVGYNARSLKAFVKGHSELYKESGRDRMDLTSNKAWCLSEVEDLNTIQRGLLNDIEEVRRADLGSDLRTCSSLSAQLAKLKAKLQETQHTLSVHTDQNLRKHLSKGPLPSAQSVQQQQIRAQYLNFQARIAQLEEEVTNLRVKIAAHGATSGKGDKPRVPTVEAVERTISKMTNMVQEKTSNIDVLELQLRKLDIAGSPVRFTSPLRNSLASRGSVSPSVRRSIFAPRTSLGANANIENTFSPRASKTRSLQGKKVSDITAVQVVPLGEQLKQRDVKVRLLEKVLSNRKVVVRKIGDETR